MYILAQHLIGRCSGEWRTKTAHAYNMLAANLHAQISQQTYAQRRPNIATNTHTHRQASKHRNKHTRRRRRRNTQQCSVGAQKGVLPRLDKSGFAGFRPTLRIGLDSVVVMAAFPPQDVCLRVASLVRAMSNLHVGTDLLAATSPLKYAV